MIIPQPAAKKLISRFNDLYQAIQNSDFMRALTYSSVIQQNFMTFSQSAIVILTSSVKPPNFYCVLKIMAQFYFPHVAEWNEPAQQLALDLFGREVSSVALRQVQKQQTFLNFGLSNNFLLTIQMPLIVFCAFGVLCACLRGYLEWYEPRVMLSQDDSDAHFLDA